MEHMDATKINDGIRDEIKECAKRGVGPVAVEGIFRGRQNDPSARNKLNDAGGRYLTTKTIRNIIKSGGIVIPPSLRNGGSQEEVVQVGALLALLGEEKYREQWYHKHVIAQYNDRDSPGVVFAHRDSIPKLKRYGFLCMMNSTHDTNSLGWPLYTVHCRDPYGSTTPRAFFLTGVEDTAAGT
jgi:hypothetical protein